MPERIHPQEPAPAPAAKPLASWYAQGLSDGLGDRLLMFDNSTAPSLELLRFRPDLADLPAFEAALREHVRRLDHFRHPAFARVRSVQRLEPDDDLALISNCTPGRRLSEVLHRARGAAFAQAVIQQLAPALVLFQQHDPGVSHGVLNPDRIIVSPDGRFTIVEHVVGPAINALDLQTAQLREMGIALPPAAGDAARLDVVNDWYQLGLVAMSALLGRHVTSSDLPQLERLLDGMSQSAGRDGTVLSPWIRQWLDRALQISSSRIESGADGRAALDELLAREHNGRSRRIAPAVTLETVSVEGDVREADRADAVVEVAPPTAEPAPLTVTPPEAAVTPAAAAPAEAGVAQAIQPRAIARAPQPIIPPPRPVEAKKPERAQAQYSARQTPVVRDPGLRTQPRVQSRPQAVAPKVQIIERKGFSTAVVAALILIVGIQAGVIVLMGGALWFAAPPAIAVQKDAAGESVLVSRKPAESTPLRLSAAPDLSWVSITSPSVEAVVGARAPATRTGTVKIASPISLKVIENARQIGSVPGGDLKLQPGKHDIELVNAALGYRLKQSLDVDAGQTVTLHVAPAQGWVNLYAVPTAVVSIDGQVVGRTPLGPLPMALGEHSITFTHATGATDRQRITVKSGETVRVIGNPRR